MDAVQAALTAVCARAFLEDVATVLTSFGVETLLGIQLTHREVLRREGCTLSEDSDFGRRTSTVRSTQGFSKDDYPVTWKTGPGRRFCEQCLPDVAHEPASSAGEGILFYVETGCGSLSREM
jgi:hypothetical protein